MGVGGSQVGRVALALFRGGDTVVIYGLRGFLTGFGQDNRFSALLLSDSESVVGRWL